MNKKLFAALYLLSITIGFAQTPNKINNIISFPDSNFAPSAIEASVKLVGCKFNAGKYAECVLTISSTYDGDQTIYLFPGVVSATLPNGVTYNSSKLSISSYNNGEFKEGEFGTKISPGIDYKLTVQFKEITSPVSQIRYLDVGWKKNKFVRLENVSILGNQQPPTPLPAPQPALNPKQYLTLNATNGYGTLSGVSLNGGLYDVNLQGCRPTDGGMAACTLTLTPMRATAQDVTLEDLNVAVNGAAVTATATATPTVMTLTVTAPVNVNRIDELRLGNARFLNVGVK